MNTIAQNGKPKKEVKTIHKKKVALIEELNELKQSHTILNDLIAKTNLIYIELDNNLKVTIWNESAVNMFGHPEDAAAGLLFSDIGFGNRQKQDIEYVLSNIKNNSTIKLETRMNTNIKDETIFCDWYYNYKYDKYGDFSGIVAIAQDVTTRVTFQNELKGLNKKIEDMFGFAPIGIYQANSEGHFISANPELAWMLGYESSQVLTEQMKDIATQMFADQKTAEEFFFNLFEAEQLNRFRCKLQRTDKSSFWAQSYAKITRDDSGKMNGFYGFCIDISDTVRSEIKMKRMNDELKNLSTIDGLTQIANRRRFDEYLVSEWNRQLREKNTLSIILCDIDFFKPYNDTYGHQMGDETLYKVAQSVKSNVKRPADLPARYGGEEFVVVLPDTDHEGAIKLAEIIRKAIRNLKIPHKNSSVDTYVTLSLGVSSIIPNTQDRPEDLIKKADLALYEAKEQGRNCVISKL